MSNPSPLGRNPGQVSAGAQRLQTDGTPAITPTGAAAQPARVPGAGPQDVLTRVRGTSDAAPRTPAVSIARPSNTGVSLRGPAEQGVGSLDPADRPLPELPQLRRGARGAEVAYLQDLLESVGLSVGSKRGTFGAVTERLVRDFQRSYRGEDGSSLGIDGITGADTWAALRERAALLASQRQALGSAQPAELADITPDFSLIGNTLLLRRGAQGTEVRRAQQLLRALGYDIPASEAGKFGRRTFEAVHHFQTHYRRDGATPLKADGEIGPLTGQALNRAIDAARELGSSWVQARTAAEVADAQAAPLERAPASAPTSAVARPSDLRPETQEFVGLKLGDRDGKRGQRHVRNFQENLKRLGYELPADGHFGQKTLAALKDFQLLYSLLGSSDVVADGNVTAQTMLAMQRALDDDILARLPPDMRRGQLATAYESGKARTVVLRPIGSGDKMETRAALAFRAMNARAAADGVSLNVVSSFRSQAQQRALYERFADQPGRAAKPGYSTHQTGIAVDFSGLSGSAMEWMKRNAESFGFELPNYGYTDGHGHRRNESWHWEYQAERLPDAVRAWLGAPRYMPRPAPPRGAGLSVS